MSDSIAELTGRNQNFFDVRDWRKYHNAKDLAVAISAEAGELMQHFVWQQDDQIEPRVEKRREEIACCLEFAFGGRPLKESVAGPEGGERGVAG